tara:strand:- start:166 stop:561 length:396 start_codon:yes stop_codon:yes gene_type:complete
MICRGLDMARGKAQNKRLLTHVWNYLSDNGPQTSQDISDWYNMKVRESIGANHGCDCRSLSAVLSSSMLFGTVGTRICTTTTGNKGKYSVYEARPLNDVVDRAIKSRKPVHKFPQFVRKAIQERLDNEELQ